MSAPHADAAKPLRRLRCCCCGGDTQGRQFWNQDTGHGLGTCCVAYIRERMSPDDIRQTYGVAGVHFIEKEA